MQFQQNQQRRLSKNKKYNLLNEQLSINLSRTKRKLQIHKNWGKKEEKSESYYRSPRVRAVKSQKYLKKRKFEEENTGN